MTERMWLLVHTKGVLLRRDGERALLLDDGEATRLGVDPGAGHRVGALRGVDVMAAPIERLPEGPPYEAFGLRALATVLDGETFGLAGRAMHVIDWATTSRYCGRCGTATVLSAKERSMICPSCGLAAYPRIAPAIIVLVRRGDRALLARNAKYPVPIYSTLAGFVDIGESLEETLAREVREEVGIEVTNIRYFGSQPWPLPHSLMIGFTAEWAGGEIRVDGEEITDAQWFAADDLPSLLPSHISIARRLIDAWTEEIAGRSERGYSRDRLT